MKIVMLSKALVSGAYQKKLEALARLPAVQLTVLVPPAWHEPGVGTIWLERRFTTGYQMEVLPIALNGRHHLHFYPTLGRVLRRIRPNIFHIDEESFNLATFLALRAGRAIGARCCFFNWANNERIYPPPFGWFEQYAFRHAAHAIAGNHEAAHILRQHGYRGPLTVLPQFGVDPDLFAPAPATPTRDGLTVGYVGRLVAAKGVLNLVEAVARLPDTVRLLLVGDGNLRPQIEQRVQELDITARVTVRPAVPSTDVPAVLQQLDVLVLPSRTMPNWKEQFGRVLIEAMSCGVPVVGSSSGEIPNVIGDAGLVFPEGNTDALYNGLALLMQQPALRHALAQRGRARVLAHYTQAALAGAYYEVYQQMYHQP
ncbi:MAG: glycosyltransferase family 4 protein [Chloroflexaceae bacterium]|nr:glycosyltransferase family 4 protein [Chloroflexaceae bacterium]